MPTTIFIIILCVLLIILIILTSYRKYAETLIYYIDINFNIYDKQFEEQKLYCQKLINELEEFFDIKKENLLNQTLNELEKMNIAYAIFLKEYLLIKKEFNFFKFIFSNNYIKKLEKISYETIFTDK